MLHGLELSFTFSKDDLPRARDFLVFLRRVAHKHSIKMIVATYQDKLTLKVPREHRLKLDLFLQELLLTGAGPGFAPARTTTEPAAPAFVIFESWAPRGRRSEVLFYL